MRVSLILNRQSGWLRDRDADAIAEELAQIHRDGGCEVSLHLADGLEVSAAVEDACASSSVDAVIVGGGDGTVSAAAGIAARGGTIFGILVSNNPLGDGHLPFADDPRRGTLALYVVKSRRLPDLLALLGGVLVGRISANPQLDRWLVGEAVEIGLRRKEVDASIDGEIVKLLTPIRCRLLRGGLRVLKPHEAPTAAGSLRRPHKEQAMPRKPGQAVSR